MARKLPWNINDRSSKVDDRRPVKRPKISPPDPPSDVKGSSAIKTETKEGELEHDDSIEYMVDGMSNDDKYIILEDELLRLARSFTADLHTREYERQLEAATSKNKTSHHVDSKTELPSVSKLKQEQMLRRKAIANSSKAHPLIKHDLDSDEELEEQMKAEDELANAGSALHRLMRSGPQRTDERDLAAICVARGAGTRAAAGYKQGAAVKNGVGSPAKPKHPLPSPVTKPLPSDLAKSASKPLNDDDETTSEEEEEEQDLDDVVHMPKPSLRGIQTTVKSSMTTSKSVSKFSSSAPDTSSKQNKPVVAARKAVSFHTPSKSTPRQVKIVDVSSDEEEYMSDGERERWRRRRAAQAMKTSS